MRIGELSARAGVNVQTIRFYEREKLLWKPVRTASGYRTFEEADLERVRFIKDSQQLGFSLKEIKELLEIHESAKSFSGRPQTKSKEWEKAFRIARERLQLINQKIEFLKVLKKPLAAVLEQPGAENAENEDGPRNQTVVDVIFPVTPGQQYKLKGLEWSGNHEFPTDTLQKMVRAEPGQPANTIRLGDNLKDIQKLYGSHGFVTAAIKADAQFDDDASTVVIHLIVTEGSVYHMGDLEFRGLDNSLTAKLRSVWRIRPGDVYDSTYLSEYLPAAQKLLPPTLDWGVSSHVTANVRERTVDVDLIYSAKAPK